MTTLTDIQKAKIIQSSDLDPELKAIGSMGALLGASNESIISGMIGVSNANETKKAETETPKRLKPRGYTKTESVIHDMLTENTGIHMMDSGMYGRHWQHNRAITDFRKLEPVHVKQYPRGDLSITKNLFHVLTTHLEYDGTMNRKFKAFCNAKSRKADHWLTLMEDFAAQYHDSNYPEESLTDNSYNSENCLSQDVQYAIFATQDDSYVILQIHGGADIRGGYTAPKVFRFSEGWDYFVLAFSDLHALCNCEGLQPYSDNAGYHWYETGNDDKDHGLPKVWAWSKRLQGMYCRDCRARVGFS